MASSFDDKRATAIIERAIERGWADAMPASEAERVVAAETIVQSARWIEQVKDQWVEYEPQIKDDRAALLVRVPTWEGAEAILFEANVLVGSSNGDEPEKEGELDVTAPQDGSASTDATPTDLPQQEAPVEAPDRPLGAAVTREDPRRDKVWLDASGTEWLVVGEGGGPQVHVRKVSTGEDALVPAGMLKTRKALPAVASEPVIESTAEESSSPVIDSFTGEYEFLSNFYPSPITIDGIDYPTVEHAFQAQKTLDRMVREQISTLETPGSAKRAGRAIDLRSDWESIKVEVMAECLREKFDPETGLAQRLVNTGEAILVEGNTWGDTYWGVCGGQGENMLGKLLMNRRSELLKLHAPSLEEQRAQAEARREEIIGILSSIPSAQEPDPRHVPDDEGDDRYASLLAETQQRYTPASMPIPRDLVDPPETPFEDFADVPDVQARELHAKYNALAARVKYLHDVEDARARGCDLVRKLFMKGAMREARAALGDKASVTEVQLHAEDDDDVATWAERKRRHSDQADAWRSFFDIYTKNVEVLSRDWTMRDKQHQS